MCTSKGYEHAHRIPLPARLLERCSTNDWGWIDGRYGCSTTPRRGNVPMVSWASHRPCDRPHCRWLPLSSCRMAVDILDHCHRNWGHSECGTFHSKRIIRSCPTRTQDEKIASRDRERSSSLQAGQRAWAEATILPCDCTTFETSCSVTNLPVALFIHCHSLRHDVSIIYDFHLCLRGRLWILSIESRPHVHRSRHRDVSGIDCLCFYSRSNIHELGSQEWGRVQAGVSAASIAVDDPVRSRGTVHLRMDGAVQGKSFPRICLAEIRHSRLSRFIGQYPFSVLVLSELDSSHASCV